MNRTEGIKKLMGYVEDMQKEGINICWPQFQQYDLLEMCLISKHYGLIKWLVLNDKIDNSKFYDKNILKGFMTLTKEEKADCIIMNLSIQESPIEYLISILK